MAKEPTTIQIYLDKFEYVSVKKYLNLKGPVQCQVVHDHMYPILRYGMNFHIEKGPWPLKKGDLFSFWDDGQIYLALFDSAREDYFVPKFLRGEPAKNEYHKDLILGPVTNIPIPFVFKLKRFFGML